MPDCITTMPGGKTLPADPATAAAFDSALRTVHEKYLAGTPLTRGELAALVNATMRLMREVR